MADSILRLRVDSQEYDNKLKRAAEGIQRYAEGCRKAGGTLTQLDDGVLDFVKALGQMDTVATSSKQQLREMSNALTTLTMVYRGLSDEEKSSPFGQELSKGIQELTERAGKAQDAMADVAASIKHAASDTRAFDQLSQGISIMTSGFQTVTGAAKLFGIQIGDNVEVIAKLQAAMAVTNGLTQAQTALQKQSALMQGVMAVQAKAAAAAIALEGKSTKAATVAQAAFNAVAKANPYVLLGSAVAAVGVALLGFSKNAKTAIEATNEETAAMKEAAKMADIWKNTMGSSFSSMMTKYDELKNQWLSLKNEHQRIEWIKKNQTAFQQLGGAVTDVKTAEDFFNNNTEAVVQSFVRRAQAAARVAQLTELYRKQIELLDKKSQISAAIGEDAKKTGRSAKAGDEIKDQTYRNSRYGSVNSAGKWVFSEKGAKLYSGTDTSSSPAVVQVDVELQANENEIKKVKSQITNEFNDVTITPVIGGGGGRGGGGNNKTIEETRELTGLIEIQQQKVKDLQEQIQQAPTESIITYLRGELIVAQGELDRLNGKVTESGQAIESAMLPPLKQMESVLAKLNEDLKNAETPEAYQNILSDIRAINAEMEAFTGKTPVQKLSNDADKSAKSFQSAASAISQVGSALNSIEDPTAKIMGIVAQAIAGVAAGAGQAVSAKDTTSSGWAWIGAAAAITASMIAMISQIHSATGYQNGGIVKGYSTGGTITGSSYSGDRIGGVVDGSQFVGLNAGELVLNKAQQSNLASQLQGGGLSNLNLTATIKGEQLKLVLNNNGRRTGRGEYVTTNFT